MLGYLSLDIICSSKLTVSLELRSRKTVRFSEQLMSADKYPSIFWRQMEVIVYLLMDTITVKHQALHNTRPASIDIYLHFRIPQLVKSLPLHE